MPQTVNLSQPTIDQIAPYSVDEIGAVDETAPASDTGSSGLNGRLQRIAQRLTALFPATIGQKTKAASLAVALASDDSSLALLGAVTETAPASDTASSGLNGRLQRIAQRLTSLLPTTIGKKLPSTSLSVTEAGYEYETVAAGQTAQVMGATGATGDYLDRVILQPATTGAATTTILDNATVIYTYTGGTLSDLKPIVIPLGLYSVSGAWKITTGANMAALAIGDFT